MFLVLEIENECFIPYLSPIEATITIGCTQYSNIKTIEQYETFQNNNQDMQDLIDWQNEFELQQTDTITEIEAQTDYLNA